MRSILEKIRRSSGLLVVAALAVLLLLVSENRTNSGNAPMSTENRLRSVLSAVKGAGDVELLVNESEAGEIIGVCVLTSNAGDVSTVFRIQRAVRTALGIDNSQIEVIMMED